MQWKRVPPIIEHSVLQLKYEWNLCGIHPKGLIDLTKVAAGIRLFGCLVECFALHRELLGLADEVVELLATYQNLLDGVAQDDFRLVEVFLHFSERVSFPRVLILADIYRQLREVGGLFRPVRPLIARDFS